MGLKEQIGKLDRCVEIVEFTAVKDAFNSKTRTQTPIKKVWAQVVFKSSTEDFEEKVYSINKRDYVIHFDPDIAVKFLQDLAVIDDGVTYYVTGVNPDVAGRKMYMLLNCKYDG